MRPRYATSQLASLFALPRSSAPVAPACLPIWTQCLPNSLAHLPDQQAHNGRRVQAGQSTGTEPRHQNKHIVFVGGFTAASGCSRLVGNRKRCSCSLSPRKSSYVRTQTCETMRNWDNHGVTSLAGTTPLVESPSLNVYPRCGATGVYWSEDTSLFHWQTRWYLRVPNSECGPCILASVCIIKGALWECVNVIIKHSTSDQYTLLFLKGGEKRDYLNLWMNSADSKALAPLDPSRPTLFWVA